MFIVYYLINETKYATEFFIYHECECDLKIVYNKN